MAQDYFAVLGLTPGRYHPDEITARFLARRQRLLAELDNPGRHVASRRELDELHLAYTALREPRTQDEYFRQREHKPHPAEMLRSLVAASLEDGLLRHSRRQAIIERALELGLTEFQAHLLIAEVQFGPTGPLLAPTPSGAGPAAESLRPACCWTRIAGVGLLALALFLFAIRLLA